jgi:hypothetical protein
VAKVDNAKAVALRIGEYDEVRVVRVVRPVDALGAQRHESLGFGLLVGE